MVNTKISQLPAVTTVGNTDVVPLVQGGITKQATAAQLLASVLGANPPAALATIKALADAIGDDANYAADVTGILATKAPTASPTFTGTVSGITTGMVGAQTAWNVRTATAAATASAWDYVLADTTPGTYPITAPAPAAGRQWGIKWVAGSAAPTLAGTFNGGITPTFQILEQAMDFISDGTAWYRSVRPALASLPDYPAVTDARYTTPAAVAATVSALASGQPDLSTLTARSGQKIWRAAEHVSPEDFVPIGTDPATITDWGPYFQAAYDAYPHVHLRGTRDYTINSSVFLDCVVFPALNTRRHYRLSGDGQARIIVGTTCATASGQTFDHGTHWAFFHNTLRSALGATTAGEVDTTAATRATGAGLPMGPFFVIDNVPIYGTAGQNTGFAFGNSSAAVLKDLSLSSLKYGLSWFGYSDGHGMTDVGIIGQPTGGWAMLQTGSGDGVVLSNVKGTSSGVWKAYGCNGGRVISPIGGGYDIHGSRAITFESPHVELDETNPYPFVVTIDNSHVLIDQALIYLGKGTQGSAIIITDDATDPYNHSDVSIRNSTFAMYYRPTDGDVVRKAAVQITAINDATRIRSENNTLVTAYYGQATNIQGLYWRGGTPLIDGSAVAGVASALASGSQQYRLSQRDWELANTANGWELVTE